MLLSRLSRSSLMSLSRPDDSRCKRVAAIRWLAVFKRTTLGLTAREVTEHLQVSASSQKRWLSSRRPATSSRRREELRAALGHS